ncbi:MAG: large subunit ribosomal protein [Verrucomicrobiota bacterium]|jgi:large subunit ribosomal protein L35
MTHRRLAPIQNLKIDLASTFSAPYSARSFLTERKLMRRPKGIKTKKSVAKRFRLTARGKAVFSRSGRRHLNQTKSAKRRRSLRRKGVLGPADLYRITQSLPFSR